MYDPSPGPVMYIVLSISTLGLFGQFGAGYGRGRLSTALCVEEKSPVFPIEIRDQQRLP